MVAFFQCSGEPNETFGQKRPRKQKLSKTISIFSAHSARRLHFNPGDSSVLSGRCTNGFWTNQKTSFVVSHSKKHLMGFGALALLCSLDISAAPTAPVQAHQFEPARSSFPQTAFLLFLPRLVTQHSCITRKRSRLSFGDFCAWATEG